MLIIALPKSASSSLALTLSSLHRVPDRTAETRRLFLHLLRDPGDVPEYGSMARFHREVQEIRPEILETVQRGDALHKYHFPPTQRNQDLLSSVKKVILLRDPVEVVQAYWRGDRSGSHPVRDLRFVDCWSERSWIARAEKVGLTDEMRRFSAGWEAHEGDKLIIHYEDLVRQPKETINKVERYFSLPVSPEVELARERYSRRPERERRWLVSLGRVVRRIRVALKEISRLLLARLGFWALIRARRARRRESSARSAAPPARRE
jgi:hypothetical protein